MLYIQDFNKISINIAPRLDFEIFLIDNISNENFEKISLCYIFLTKKRPSENIYKKFV